VNDASSGVEWTAATKEFAALGSTVERVSFADVNEPVESGMDGLRSRMCFLSLRKRTFMSIGFCHDVLHRATVIY
jgi:hypothetical protein